MGSGKLIKQAIAKYGVNNFKKEILFIYDNFKNVDIKEKEIVTEEFVAQENTYNLQVGGFGIGHVTNKSKQKISKSRLGIKFSLEHKAKLSMAAKKRKASSATKRKMSEAGKGRTVSKKIRDKISQANKGRIFTDEHKAKISQANKGKLKGPMSNETKAKLSKAHKGRIFTDEHKAKISATKRANNHTSIS